MCDKLYVKVYKPDIEVREALFPMDNTIIYIIHAFSSCFVFRHPCLHPLDLVKVASLYCTKSLEQWSAMHAVAGSYSSLASQHAFEHMSLAYATAAVLEICALESKMFWYSILAAFNFMLLLLDLGA